jgi:aryl-alcohol dehydrogenase
MRRAAPERSAGNVRDNELASMFTADFCCFGPLLLPPALLGGAPSEWGSNVLIQAAITSDGGGFEINEVDLGAPRADEVLVRVTATGVCHTDLSCADGLFPIPMPIVLGHEGAGVVESVGDAVQGLVAGDHVVMSFDSCGTCRYCRRGLPSYCVSFIGLNFGGQRTDGTTSLSHGGSALHSNFFGQSSFAGYSVCPQRSVVKIDSDVPFEYAAPLGCGIQTGAGAILNTLKVPPGATLAVVGTGGVGLSAVMAGRLCGAGIVVAVDPVPARRSLALELGADLALDPQEGDFAEQLVALTGGLDFAVDTSGQPAVITQAFEALRPLGTLALIGGPAAPLFSFDPYKLLAGRTVRGLTEGDALPQEFVPMLLRHWRNGRFPVDRLVTTFGFADIDKAVDSMRSHTAIKPVLLMD